MDASEQQRTRRFGRALAWLALLGAGCTRNADLEVTLELPAAPAGTATYAFVQFDRPPADLSSEWVSTGDFDGVRLGSESTTARYSLVTERIDGDVLVKVRFCASPRCGDDLTQRSLHYVLQHPFHLAQRTEWQRRIDVLPDAPATTPEIVDRCEIGGCIVPYRPDVWYCREDGTHFCDPFGSLPADAAVRDAARPRDAASLPDTAVDAARPDAARDAARDAREEP